MVYFTIRYNNDYANIYISYANEAFDRLETIPNKIEGIGGIDADITLVDDTYHLYYVSGAKFFYASSDLISKGYVPSSDRIDPNEVSTEAPNVFKRLGTDTYVLMYDVYDARPNNMGFSETTDIVEYQHLGRFNEGDSPMKTTNFERPKHGAVTYLTEEELQKVIEYYKVDASLLK